MDRFMNFIGYELGDFEIHLERPEAWVGHCVSGIFHFSFRKPTEARKVCVQLEATETRVHREVISYADDEYREEVRHRQAYERTLYLDGERVYHEGHYPFAFEIPHHAPASYPPQQFGWIEEVSHFGHGCHGPDLQVDWVLRAWLDIPWGGDPVRELRLQVHPHGCAPPGYAPTPPGPTYPPQGAIPSPAPRPTVGEASRRTPPPAPPVPSERTRPKFCRHCGAPAGKRFCGHCGANLG